MRKLVGGVALVVMVGRCGFGAEVAGGAGAQRVVPGDKDLAAIVVKRCDDAVSMLIVRREKAGK